MCFRWRRDLEGKLFKESLSSSIDYRPHRKAQLFFGTEVICDSGSNSHRSGNGRATTGEKKQKQIEYLSQTRLRSFATRNWSRYWGASHNRLALTTQQIDDDPSLRPDWTTAFRKPQGKSCCVCSALQGKLRKESQLLGTHGFPRRV